MATTCRAASALASAAYARPQRRPVPSAPRAGQRGGRTGIVTKLKSRVGDEERPASAGPLGDVRQAAVGVAAAVAMALGAPQLQAMAASNADVGPCVLRSCGIALAQCLADPTCVENLACLQACEGSPDKAGCQVKCGDFYNDKAVERFDTCALSEKKCVPQIPDDGSYPKPPDCAVSDKFNTKDFQGKWYITAGLNPLFDTFDCQAHFFTEPRPGVIYGGINWRVKKPNGFWYQRNAMQQLVQQPDKEGHLVDTGGEFLHFSDDWYVLGSKFEGGDNDYLLVYYRGNNDAWLGYGGGFIYTRAASLPEAIVPQVKEQLAAAGLDWNKWTITDNTCGPEPRVLEEEVLEAEEALTGLEKRFVTAVENEVGVEVAELELDVENEIGMLKMAVEKELAFLKDAEQELVDDVQGLTNSEKRKAIRAKKEKQRAEKSIKEMMKKDGMEMPM